MHIRSIDDAPSANDYLKALEYEESSREFRPVPAVQAANFIGKYSQ